MNITQVTTFPAPALPGGNSVTCTGTTSSELKAALAAALVAKKAASQAQDQAVDAAIA